MHIEDRLITLDSKLDSVLKLLLNGAIPENESGVAGAGADPVVAQQVGEAIAAAAPAAPVKRGRGRPAKTETAPPADVTPPAQSPTPADAFDPFALEPQAPAAVVEKARSLDEVRAALAVYQANNTQAAAISLFKTVTGADTIAKLAVTDYPKLFKAAVPADKFVLADVRAVLVKLNERKAGAGMEVLTEFKASDITQLTEDKFVAVILKAHATK